jgi:hypothetical protein
VHREPGLLVAVSTAGASPARETPARPARRMACDQANGTGAAVSIHEIADLSLKHLYVNVLGVLLARARGFGRAIHHSVNSRQRPSAPKRMSQMLLYSRPVLW